MGRTEDVCPVLLQSASCNLDNAVAHHGDKVLQDHHAPHTVERAICFNFSHSASPLPIFCYRAQPAYVSPERYYHCVCSGRTIAATCSMDMWSFGVMTFNMFSGDSLSSDALFSNSDEDATRDALLGDLGNNGGDPATAQAAEARVKALIASRLGGSTTNSSIRHAVERLPARDHVVAEALPDAPALLVPGQAARRLLVEDHRALDVVELSIKGARHAGHGHNR